MAEMTTTIPARWRVLLGIIRRLPQGAVSRLAGRLADIPIPSLLRPPVLGLFARCIGADVSEAELPLGRYRTLNQLFVRRLKPGTRTLPEDPSLLVSPVDGVVSVAGSIKDGRLLQVKGRTYSLAALLDDPAEATRLEGGLFVTIYLSPRHYHRIHSPSPGSIHEARHVPGCLLPVNPPSTMLSPDLFARNERLICHIEGGMGKVAVVAVGALNVGRISAAFDAEWNTWPPRNPAVTNRPGAVTTTHRYSPGIPVQRGDEIMAFHLGSSVVVLLEPGRAELLPEIVPGLELRMGRPIAASTHRDPQVEPGPPSPEDSSSEPPTQETS